MASWASWECRDASRYGVAGTASSPRCAKAAAAEASPWFSAAMLAQISAVSRTVGSVALSASDSSAGTGSSAASTNIA